MSYLYVSLVWIVLGIALVYVIFQLMTALVALPVRKVIDWVMLSLKGRKSRISI